MSEDKIHLVECAKADGVAGELHNTPIRRILREQGERARERGAQIVSVLGEHETTYNPEAS